VRFLWPRVAYRPLIGPTFFPVYVLVLKLALGLTVLVTAGFAILGPTGDAKSRGHIGHRRVQSRAFCFASERSCYG